MSRVHSEEEHLLNKYPSLINCAAREQLKEGVQATVVVDKRGFFWNFLKLFSQLKVSPLGGAEAYLSPSWPKVGLTPRTARRVIAGQPPSEATAAQELD